MRIKVLWILTFFLLFLGTFSSTVVFAQFDDNPFEGCGTWNNDRSVPLESLCVEYGAYDEFIYPFVECTNNRNVCCPAAAIPSGCEYDDPTDMPDPDDEPEPSEEPGIYEESNQDCGSWFTDGGVGGTICLDTDDKIILNAADCSQRVGMCCRQGACPQCWEISLYGASCQPCSEFPERPTFDDESECYAALPDYDYDDYYGDNSDVSSGADPYDICASNLDPSSDAFTNCTTCDGIWTAVGCITDNPRSITSRFISIGTGIVGGVFLLRVLAAAFMLVSSQGDVKKTSEAKEMITEAIAGVIVILMSVSLIQFVGSGILKIPGFGS